MKQLLVDSHCHLFFDGIKSDLPFVIDRAKADGVGCFICPGINLDSSKESISIAEKYPEVYAAVGIHPHDVEDAPGDYISQLKELSQNRKVAAIGEIGLDYFRDYSDHRVQRKLFREQIELAMQLNYPIIFHNRTADKDVLNILKETGCNRGVAHCFSSDIETANAFIDLGFYISFAGNVTYKNSGLAETAKEIPLQKMLLETDSPFLSPTPFRGKPNEPARVRPIAEHIAKIRECPVDEIIQATTKNVRALFELDTR